jgi:hypothetical protein
MLSLNVNSSYLETHCDRLLSRRFLFTFPLETDTMGPFQGTQAHIITQYHTIQTLGRTEGTSERHGCD